MLFTPEGLRHLVAQVGASQVMLGTDHPIPWEEHPVDHVFATTTLTDKQKVAILGGNAARLFGMSDAAVQHHGPTFRHPSPQPARCLAHQPCIKSFDAFELENQPSADLAAF
jgi:amidohydrolase family protein